MLTAKNPLLCNMTVTLLWKCNELIVTQQELLLYYSNATKVLTCHNINIKKRKEEPQIISFPNQPRETHITTWRTPDHVSNTEFNTEYVRPIASNTAQRSPKYRISAHPSPTQDSSDKHRPNQPTRPKPSTSRTQQRPNQPTRPQPSTSNTNRFQHSSA
jgi:hypothetical protein